MSNAAHTTKLNLCRMIRNLTLSEKRLMLLKISCLRSGKMLESATEMLTLKMNNLTIDYLNKRDFMLNN